MKALAVLTLSLLSTSVLAANCTKHPYHPKCAPKSSHSTGGLTVVSGDGSIIGNAMSIDAVASGYRDYSLYADVRLEYDGHGYVLRFFGDSTFGIGFNGKSAHGFWEEPGCMGYPQYFGNRRNSISRIESTGLEPFISKYFTVIEIYDGDSGPRNSFADLSPFLAHLEPYSFSQINLYEMTKDIYGRVVCAYSTYSNTTHTLYSIYDPIDIKSQYSAPITFVPN